MLFRTEDLVILLGAGASADAGVPTSTQMIAQIEGLLESETDWKIFRDLYNYVKSAIFYADGLEGRFGNRVSYNIERLVNVLLELEKREKHEIYSFIGNWNNRLLELAGQRFENILSFRKLIVKRLKDDWMALKNYKEAEYLGRLYDLKDELNFALRVFTLNYDLCLERNGTKRQLGLGFNENRIWDWQYFQQKETDDPIDIYLYKIHGSIDWDRTETEELTYSDDIGKIDAEMLAKTLIFGTNYKLQYNDPYLFYAYEFRRYTLSSKMILAIGYGFSDAHINGILSQALRQDSNRLLVAVDKTDKSEDERRKEIVHELDLKKPDQVRLVTGTAKEFMTKNLRLAELKGFFPEARDASSPF